MKSTNIRRFIGSFHLEFQAKAFIAGYFLRDCSDWITIYRQISKFENFTLSLQAKSFITLRFAFECGLKAMMAALSKQDETAEQAYKALRKCSHQLECLVRECQTRGASRVTIVSPSFASHLARVDALGVGFRYDLDFKTAYKKQPLAPGPYDIYGDGPVSGVVLSSEFRNQMFQEVTRVYDRALRIYQKRLGKHSMRVASNQGAVEDYMRKIVK